MTAIKNALEMAVTEALEASLGHQVVSWVAAPDENGDWEIEEAKCDDGVLLQWASLFPLESSSSVRTDPTATALRALISYVGAARDAYVWIRPEFRPEPPLTRRPAFRDLIA